VRQERGGGRGGRRSWWREVCGERYEKREGRGGDGREEGGRRTGDGGGGEAGKGR